MSIPVRTSVNITVRSAAKINLHLGVGAPRDDGFHPLTTVYQAVGLCDDLTATLPGEQDAPWDLRLRVADYIDPGAVPVDDDNIVARAATLLAAHHGVPVRGHIDVDKAIPVAGGLAGGSADAAAALVALDRLWDARTSDDDLLTLAAELGSDVPFALIGGTALGTGRGELVTPLPDGGTWWWVLVPSRDGLATPDVYRHFDKLFPDAPAVPPPADELLDAVASGDPVRLARLLRNDLQEPALDLRPDLGVLLERGESEGALRGIISGSGPTCAFLCESSDHARDLAGALMRHGRTVVLVANGAVAGAHLVENLHG
ncbi:4-diphosphocytidyl-2-C-methyl-D-erythritol kinase [Nocardioides psychrotolerans]|uniref:4-diphosphocytidyl-2-C-methyl-D-erythritol kinase n=1 Tax=Nocardioides psychrotolerans TaxID=1005945 RepID=A0A1I3HHR5_9ACTN|nr:4-(cytidine 5'-diphospho)-2-C-methyl-D-erythritol kinase [Nocardioides psychrotolerans]GEP37597.1 4-diphosphocytidyl-2-C-methyl-D-erythritol kinase [Nocardioides psychrotolerans]SFI35107.1 4-diphosphocytidyl-2-C-methyl-D-erythritol kinase [Nocardioides psychrotolerans]